MNVFRVFLPTCLIAIVGYTSITIANHGANLLPVFFGDMAKMAWPGQFNLDFMTFLILAGICFLARRARSRSDDGAKEAD